MSGNKRIGKIKVLAANPATAGEGQAALVALGRIEQQAIMLAPVSGHGRFIVVLTSSVTGDLARRSVRGRMPAFAEAVRTLRERAAAEATNNPAPMRTEVIAVRIEEDLG
jgi:hypothetical protein